MFIDVRFGRNRVGQATDGQADAKKPSQVLEDTIPTFASRDRVKPRRTEVTVACLPLQNRIWDLTEM
jgi:hypothetical protein